MNHSSTLGFSPRPPVLVWGTGGLYLKLRGFSWKHDYDQSNCPKAHSTIRFSTKGGFANLKYTYTIYRTIPSVRRSFTTSSPHRSISQYWNINQLSIGFPVWVHLRSRLTLIRLALIRKPWSIGERVSRPLYRYLCLHFLFQLLQHSLQNTFNATGMLPYHSVKRNP